MFNSRTLAKHLVDNFVRKLPDDDCEGKITTVLENWRIAEINKYINNINTENMAKMKQKEVVTKVVNPNIQRNRAWPRGI